MIKIRKKDKRRRGKTPSYRIMISKSDFPTKEKESTSKRKKKV